MAGTGIPEEQSRQPRIDAGLVLRYRCPNGKSKGRNSFFNVGEENSLEL